MIVSFTQTYGDDRRELLDIYFRDKKLLEFKDKFDVNFYSFHNSSDETVDYFKSKNKVQNTEVLRFNNCTYTDCIRSLLKILDKIDCTHLFFSQDDTFSMNNEQFDFNMFLDFVKTKKEDFMVCLAYSYEEKIELGHIKPLKNKIYKVYSNSILEATTLDYLYVPCIPPIRPTWNMSDDPYIASFDLVKRFYDERYLSFDNIWDAEKHLFERFQNERMTRHLFEYPLFRNHNILGPSGYDSEMYKLMLMKKGLLSQKQRIM